MESKYHAGELHLQEKFGEHSIAKRTVRMIKNEVIESAIPFLENQTFIIVSSKDENGRIWSSMLIGKTGWITVSSKSEVLFSFEKITSPMSDVFFENIKNHNRVGMIFIELGTRRRYRINGTLKQTDTELKLTIEEAYPNCPKYINRRVLTSAGQNPSIPSNTGRGTILNEAQKEQIAMADTFFVSSISTEGTMDASHRGGKKGFIEILDDGILKIPDYKGNSMFNTLGNIYENPNSGLIFIDFEKGNVLQLTGTTSLIFDQASKEDKQKTNDTGRYWLFKTEAWVQADKHHKIHWEYLDESPFNQF